MLGDWQFWGSDQSHQVATHILHLLRAAAQLSHLQESSSPGWVAGIGMNEVNTSHRSVAYRNGGKSINWGVRWL